MFDRRGFGRTFALGIARAGVAPIGAGASGATGEIAPQSFILQRNGWVPNNPRLPVLFYKNAIQVAGDDPASLFEAAFRRNGWLRNGATASSTFITAIRPPMRFSDSRAAARASCLEVPIGAKRASKRATLWFCRLEPDIAGSTPATTSRRRLSARSAL